MPLQPGKDRACHLSTGSAGRVGYAKVTPCRRSSPCTLAGLSPRAFWMLDAAGRRWMTASRRAMATLPRLKYTVSGSAAAQMKEP